MKKINKKRIMMLGITCLSSASILVAGGLVEKINAEMRKDYSIVIDGKQMELNGQYPITYQGTTYLPVRKIAESINKEVNWDSSTNTVILGEKISNQEKGKTLYDICLETDASTGGLTQDTYWNGAKEYSLYYNIISHISPTSYSYDIGGKYNLLTGKVNTKSKDNVYFYIIDKDTEEVLYKDYTSNGESKSFSIDVSNVKSLSFQMKGTSMMSSAGFNDVLFF